jgi:hypothetical protein
MKTPHDTDAPRSEPQIEAHLKSCTECERKAAELDRMLASLTDHKEVFCPETWQLFDFAVDGEDPTGMLTEHVEHCPACAEKVAEFQASTGKESLVPPALEHAFKTAFPASIHSPSFWSRFADFLSSFSKAPIMVVATAAAAVLAVVILYPRGGAEPLIGLSSVSWESQLSLMAPEKGVEDAGKPTIAVILFFKDFKQPWPQDRIDSLYRALQPTAQMKKRFAFVSPDEVQATLQGKGLPSSKGALLETLHKDLDVSRVVTVTLKPDGEGVSFDAELVDVNSGRTAGKQSEPGVANPELASRIKGAAFSLIEARGNR